MCLFKRFEMDASWFDFHVPPLLQIVNTPRNLCRISKLYDEALIEIKLKIGSLMI